MCEAAGKVWLIELIIEMKMLSKIESRSTLLVLMEIAVRVWLYEQNPRHDSDLLFMRWTLSEGKIRLMHLIENVSDETMNCCYSRSLFFYVWERQPCNESWAVWVVFLFETWERFHIGEASSPTRILSFSLFQHSTKLGFDW